MPTQFYETNNVIKVPRFEEKAGFYTTKNRSETMAKIKGKNTKAELILRRALWATGIRFRVNVKSMPGKPDILLKKYGLAIFIDGSFWHGYNWMQKRQKIKSNIGFWIPKIERNIQRDRINDRLLNDMGFTVMRFWDHDIKKNLSKCTNQIFLYIESAGEVSIPSKY